MSGSRPHEGPSYRNPFSPNGVPVPFYRVLIPVTVAVLTAFAVMAFVHRIPAKDLVDDIGPSLMRGYEGYSETAEQRGFVSFVLASVVAGSCLARFVSCCSDRFVAFWGTCLSWLILISVLIFFQNYLSVQRFLALGLSIIGTLYAGRCFGRLQLDREKIALPIWILSLILWGAVFEQGTYVFLKISTVFASAIALFVGAVCAVQWLAPTRMVRIWPWITAATYLAILWMTFIERGIVVSLMMAGNSLIFVSASSSEQSHAWRMRFASCKDWIARTKQRQWWISFAAAVLLIEVGYLLTTILRDALDVCLILLQGVFTGLLLCIGRHEAPEPRFPVDFSTSTIWAQRRWVYPLMIFFASASRGWDGLWFGVCLVVVTAILMKLRGFQVRSRTSTGYLLVGLLAAACIPDLNKMEAYDTFHDGQILSGIWEFEHGSQLYSRVFPLRGAKFILGWLSRMIFVPNFRGTFVLDNFSNAAAIAGACLVAFAWRRSPLWAVVIGLLVRPGGEILGRLPVPFWSMLTGLQVHSFGDPREGIMLLVCGLTCEILRRRAGFLPLVAVGLPMFLLGFDMMTPFLGGVAAAVFCGELGRGSFISQLARGAASSLALVLALLCAFTGLLILFQGHESAFAFWRIYVDYCRHFASFCGTPLEVSRMMDIELFGLSVFAAAGAAQWRRMSRRRRQLWAFLLVTSTLFWFRALGRSDFGHVAGPLRTLHLLWALNALELLLLVSRLRLGFFPRELHYAGAALLLILVFSAGGTSNPFRFFQQVREISTEPRTLRPVDSTLDALVGSDEYLWATDYGIANYVQQRHNPTRHAQAFCISSPDEQRIAVSDLESRPPKVILWYWTPFDGIHGLTRQYILSNYVLRHFQPGGRLPSTNQIPYAVPNTSDWKGLEIVPPEYAESQVLRRLPRAWAQYRWPRMHARIRSRSPIEEWHPIEKTSSEETDQTRWQAAISLNPREINYLLLEFTVESDARSTSNQVSDPRWTTVDLRFASNGDFDNESLTTWDCPADGHRYTYLVPIGCHAAWTWRTEVRQMQLLTSAGARITGLKVDALDIDDLTFFP